MAKRPFSKHNPVAQSVLAAFEYHVHPEPNSGCWLWIGPIFESRGGYGSFTMASCGIVRQRAHRVSWRLYCSEITEKDHVLHHCDITCCVNPDHLFLGDQTINMDDKVAKVRQNRGENHGRHKLTEQEAIAIIYDPRKQKEIALDYDVTHMTICDIKRGRSWKHLKRPD